MDIQTLVKAAANKANIPYEYLKRQVYRESTNNPKAVGDNGKSRGLMQIYEPTATSVMGIKQADLSKLFDPAFNLDKGTTYINSIRKDLRPYFPSENAEFWGSVFMAYNSGPAYTKKALANLKSKGNTNPTFQNVVSEIQSPKFGRTPLLNMTVPYAQYIVSGLKAFIRPAIGAPLVIAILAGTYFLLKKMKEVDSAKTSTAT